MENMVLAHFIEFLDAKFFVGTPHDEGNLYLLPWSHHHGHTMHVEVVLAQRFPVVGNVEHAAVPVLYLAKHFYNGVYQIIGIDDGVVVGIHQFIAVCLGHFHCCADRCEHFE